jgi:uncharacterized protein YndB with AHSA1/START domain
VSATNAVSTNSKQSSLSFPSDRELVSRRVLDAPRALVFKAYTDPALIPQWWGPRKYTTVVDKMDLRPGGVWRYVQRDAEGNEFAFNGVYREVVPPERLVSTFEFEGVPGHIVVDTLTLEERDGKTILTAHSRFENAEDLKGMVDSGMESGWNESLERLQEVLNTLKAGRNGSVQRLQEAMNTLKSGGNPG